MSIQRDDLIALALGTLSPQDEARVQAALEADPELQAEYSSDLAALHALADHLPPAQVPEGAADRLMARVRAERQAAPPPLPLTPAQAQEAPTKAQSGRKNWGLGLGALGLAAALALFFALRPPADPLTRYAAMPGAVSQPLTGADQTQIGQVVRLENGSAFLYLSAAPPSDRVYQLWKIEGGTPVSLGVIDGQGKLVQDAPDGLTLAVSVEPPGGSEQPTTTPILVQQL
ncbi:anti-sigma factor domain-containing protein [Deinococcus humi]|uniref:Regulator of SigK n=1 Tax=Deinococcus humi TaxID=662880 RepID=A0A7W8JZJ9_9DEIO|nr:anti-sigma factor [Deinococcus humi]MBB5364676.1 anti-sigma-K factor RskA [Deinococcus humi]GGO34211.1 anti-sigma E factor [Deinococcus humi]